jgi:hypothetical protein
MKTTVELWLSKKANTKIVKEVRELTKFIAVNKDEIEILQDESDSKLLIINFTSSEGKQDDLAHKTLKNYSRFLDAYSDIAIHFHTKKRNRKPRSRR